MDTSAVNILSLCSGGGGLDLGVELAVPGARVVCHVEREAFGCEVLAQAMQDGLLAPAPVWTDLATFDGRQWRGLVDIITAGYPCQPFSVAGKRRGTDDPRHLWPHVARIIREVAPGYVFLENVAGHLILGYPEVAGELSEIGYDAVWTIVSAAQVGATHQRKRLFVLANAGGQPHIQDAAAGGGHKTAGLATGPSGELAAAPAVDNAPRGQHQGGCATVEAGQQRLHPGPGGSIPLFPPGPADIDAWAEVLATHSYLAPALEPYIRGMADELASRVDRLRMLGNGVVPLQAAYAFRTLAAFVEDIAHG